MYELSMCFPSLSSFVSFSSDHMCGCLELFQAEGQETLLGFLLQQSPPWSAWRNGVGNKGKGGSFESAPGYAPKGWAEGKKLLLKM